MSSSAWRAERGGRWGDGMRTIKVVSRINIMLEITVTDVRCIDYYIIIIIIIIIIERVRFMWHRLNSYKTTLQCHDESHWNSSSSHVQLELYQGIYGIDERNERGDRLLDFCHMNSLFITNTKFNSSTSSQAHDVALFLRSILSMTAGDNVRYWLGDHTSQTDVFFTSFIVFVSQTSRYPPSFPPHFRNKAKRV